MAVRVVIVGAGECGARAAFALRERGFAGTVTLVGEEAVPPYERPPLSKAALRDATPSATYVRSAADYEAAGIELIGGEAAVHIDRHQGVVQLASKRELGYDKLVLATGARARSLDIDGGEHALVLRTNADARRLRQQLEKGRRIGIVGGGFIGLEVAAAASSLGCDVTVIELTPHVLGRAVPVSISDLVEARHRAAGVDVRCGATVVSIGQHDGRYRLDLADGQGIDCDVVLAGVGAVPNTELADAAGLEIDNGIAVDEDLAADDEAIYAAGDCCSFPHRLFGGRRIRLEAWRNAIDQAEHVAKVIIGGREPFLTVPWFWSDQYELCLQIAGIVELASVEVARHRTGGVVVRFGLDDDGRLVSVSGIGPGTAVAKDVRLAEMLIAIGASPDPERLADPAINLKHVVKESA